MVLKVSSVNASDLILETGQVPCESWAAKLNLGEVTVSQMPDLRSEKGLIFQGEFAGENSCRACGQPGLRLSQAYADRLVVHPACLPKTQKLGQN